MFGRNTKIAISKLAILAVLILQLIVGGGLAYSLIVKADDGNPASIGFKSTNISDSSNRTEYYGESNDGLVELRISISEAQSSDTIFTLSEQIIVPDISLSDNWTEDIENDPNYNDYVLEWESYWQNVFNEQGNIFQYATSYSLPAGQTYVDVILHQNSNAENLDVTRLRELIITIDNENVEAGYDPNSTGIRSILNVVIYDLDGDNSIIIAQDNTQSSEVDGYRTFKIIRTGDNSLLSITPSFQYKLINYDITNEKELIFETTQSTYSFKIVNGKYESEASLKLKFYDNDYLNWQSVYTMQFSNFIYCGTQYFNNNIKSMQDYGDNIKESFFIDDDELSSLDTDGMVVLNLSQSNPYIRAEENYDAVLPEEGGNLSYEIYTRPSTGKSVVAYRLFSFL